ncbi:MAG: cardiolipin synthase [Clostridia bacterium]|nr:cardiolipin synthase [Clostridia bacterium]
MQNSSEESRGMKLLKKGQKGLVSVIFSRTLLIILSLVLQVFILFMFFHWFQNLLPHFWGGSLLFSTAMVIYLINTEINPTAKLTWMVIIMLLPVFGCLLFFYTQSEIGHRAVRGRVEQLITQTGGILPQNENIREELKAEAPECAQLSTYINRNGCQPVYKNTEVKFFSLGEDMWQELLTQLEKAESFIFLEYFIVDEGLMWGTVLEILARKVKEGVDVRLLYDGTCEFTTLPHDYPERLKKLGIKCRMFAPVMPMISTHYNYRDHRKIAVIDGKVAFNGGVNLADEYINRINKYGHWKDTAVMLKGEAVSSFTLMFLQMWNITEKNPGFEKYLNLSESVNSHGFVQPFGDCPLDGDKVGERVYMDILNTASNYVYIMTPYLILDGELETALKFAAERGVKVRLILPGKSDKAAAYALAKTHYRSLMKSGIEIYEYTPGFVHAKMFLCDDIEAVVGTINLDYRSLYHHFECATWMYDTDCIEDIEKDFELTLEKCRRVTPDTIWQGSKVLKPVGYLLKAVAPLM